MTRAHLLELAALSRRRERARQGLFLVEGVRSVESAIDAGASLVEILAAHDAPARVRDMLERSGAPVRYASAKELERVSDARTSQGVVAVARSIVSAWDGTQARGVAASGVVLLDAVQDPGNVGTIIRTAAWFGLGAVVCGPGTADLESPKVVRAAAGGLWDVALYRSDDVGSALDALTAAGVSLWGADVEGEPVETWRPAGPLGLVLGGEANGLSAESRGRLTGTVAIPRRGNGRGTESLNVAVAAGVLMHRWPRSISGR